MSRLETFGMTLVYHYAYCWVLISMFCMNAEDLWCQHSSTIRRLVCTAGCDTVQGCACSRLGTDATSGCSVGRQASCRIAWAVQLPLEGLEVSWHCACRGYILPGAPWLFDCSARRSTESCHKDSSRRFVSCKRLVLFWTSLKCCGFCDL